MMSTTEGPTSFRSRWRDRVKAARKGQVGQRIPSQKMVRNSALFCPTTPRGHQVPELRSRCGLSILSRGRLLWMCPWPGPWLDADIHTKHIQGGEEGKWTGRLPGGASRDNAPRRY